MRNKRVVMEEKERYVYHEVSNEVEAYECYWDNQECCELFDDKAVLNRLNEKVRMGSDYAT